MNQGRAYEYLRRNWLGVVGCTLGFIGIGATIYAYYDTRQIKALTFLEDPTRLSIIDAKQLAEAPLSVVRRDGRRVNGSVTAIRFAIWNSGTQPIFSNDILRPLV